MQLVSALNSMALDQSQPLPEAPPPRLVRAAHEFEAQMMKELLKPMTSSDPLTGEDEASGSGSAGALGEFASEAMARALSEQGGFGVADKIIQDLSPIGHQRATAQVTGIRTAIPR
jgi:Rod binding domain-containing protein